MVGVVLLIQELGTDVAIQLLHNELQSVCIATTKDLQPGTQRPGISVHRLTLFELCLQVLPVLVL
jgi:hypothetical protein